MGNANVKGPATESQTIALTISRTAFSIPSLVGSLYIVQHVIRCPKRRRRVFSRLMLAMSAMDCIFSITTLASAWPCPRELPIYMAAGSWGSCEAFGFLGQGGKLSSILYNGALALYFLVTIRYSWTERQFARRRVEPFIHAFCLLAGWTTALVALILDLYNPTPVGCVIYPFPPTCELEGTTCLRGALASTYRLALFYIPFWVILGIMVISMIMIYGKLSATERTMARMVASPRPSSDSPNQLLADSTQLSSSLPQQPQSTTATNELRITSLTKEFAIQALLYCLAFMFTWLFGMVAATSVRFSEKPAFYYPIAYLSTVLGSLQGCFNACIYIRPRYLRYRRLNKQQQQRREYDEEKQGYEGEFSGDDDGRQASSSGEITLRVLALRKALSVDAMDDEDELLEQEEEEGIPDVQSVQPSRDIINDNNALQSSPSSEQAMTDRS